MIRRGARFLTVLLLGLAQPAAGQATDSTRAHCDGRLTASRPGWSTVMGEYARVAQIAGAADAGSWMVRRSASAPRLCSHQPQPWQPRISTPPTGTYLELLPVHTRTEFNSTYPYERNNSSLWGGRGVGGIVETGVAFRSRHLEVELRPSFRIEQNRAFELPSAEIRERSPYSYPWHSLDYPLRFGDRSRATIEPGQSMLRARYGGATAGVSTQNLWWGPAIRNPLILSNTAGGFPHAFLGTDGPRDVGVGEVELELLWGRLSESDFFDDDASNDARLLGGLAFVFRPRWMPGFHIGLLRIYEAASSELDGLSDYLVAPYLNVRSNASENQILAVVGRWVLPQSGFEGYVEWAREDHWEDLKDLIKEPNHSQAYTIGAHKVYSLAGARWIRVFGELNHLASWVNFRDGRHSIPFYTHSGVKQGHTHEGQLLGAPIGPGSDAQALGVDLFTPDGRTGLLIERTRYDDDAYYDRWASFYEYRGHDVEVSASVNHTRRLGSFDLDVSVGYSGRYNRNFVGFERLVYEFRYDRNLRALLNVTWEPPRALLLGGWRQP